MLDAALEQAPDRAKAQFSLLVGETVDAPGDQPYTGGPFSVSLEDMTSPEWTGDDARRLSLSFDSALERSAVEDIERLAHLWLICDPPQVIELNAGRRIGEALVSAVEHRVIQLRRADDFITGTASRDLMQTETVRDGPPAVRGHAHRGPGPPRPDGHRGTSPARRMGSR